MRAARLVASMLVIMSSVPSPAGAQRLFEGSVRYDVVIDGKPSQFVIRARDAKVRQDTSIPDSDGVAAITYEGCEIYVLESTPGAEWCITSELGHFLAFEGQQGQLRAGTTAAFQSDDRLPRTTTLRFKNGAAVLKMRMTNGAGGRWP